MRLMEERIPVSLKDIESSEILDQGVIKPVLQKAGKQ